MSWITHDLKCTDCSGVMYEILYKRNAEPPACAACGGSTSISWASGRAPVGGAFKPLNLGHTTVHSKAELDAEVARLEKAHPGKSVVLSGWNEQQAKEKAEFHYNRAYQSRKSKGISENMVPQHRAERDKFAAEQAKLAEKRNQNPEKARKKAKKEFGSLSKAVGAPGQ